MHSIVDIYKNVKLCLSFSRVGQFAVVFLAVIYRYTVTLIQIHQYEILTTCRQNNLVRYINLPSGVGFGNFKEWVMTIFVADFN